MTKKIDEAVSLNVSTTQGEMTSTTTFTAEDTAALATMLKNAGIAGNSTMFNGAATLSMDVSEAGGTMNTVIQAPDLRSIMQLLEPEFAATAELDQAVNDNMGDMADMDGEPDLAPESPVDAQDDSLEAARAQALDDLNNAFDDGQMAGVELYDPGMDPYGDELEGEVEEAVIDAGDAFKKRQAGTQAMRTNNTLADISAGVDNYLSDILGTPEKYSDEDGVVVDAGDEFRSRRKEIDRDREYAYNQAKLTGVSDPSELYYDDEDEDEDDHNTYRDHEDDDLEEDADYDYRGRDVHPQAYDGVADRKPAQPATKAVPTRSGDNPLEEDQQFPDSEEGAVAALKAMSLHDTTGATARPDPMVAGVWLVTHKGGRSMVYLNDGDFEDIDESVKKSFVDYVNETKARNHIEPKKPVEAGDLLDEFRLNELSNDTKNNYFKKAADDINNHANHSDKMRGIGNHDQADKHDAKIMKRAHGMNRAIAREEEELDEAGRTDWNQKIRQYGKPYYLNTDCGFSSLEMIMDGEGYFTDMLGGLATHSGKVGFTVLEIERSGKKGFNYVNSYDGSLQPGTPVTCITQTSTGQKFRPGKFVTSFTARDLSMNYDQVVAELAKLGITPSKKLPVKTFD